MLNATVAGGSVRLKKPGCNRTDPPNAFRCSPDGTQCAAPGAHGAGPPTIANDSLGSPNCTQFAAPKQLITISNSKRSEFGPKFCPKENTRSLFVLLVLNDEAAALAGADESYVCTPKSVVFEVNNQLTMASVAGSYMKLPESVPCEGVPM